MEKARKKKRKLLSCMVLTASMILSSVSPALAMSSDIQGHWAEKSITASVDKGLVKGYQDGTFKPEKEITRAEFITLVNKFFNFNEVAPVQYSDVPSASWFTPEIAKAKAADYISGYKDNTMKPNASISRQEAAVILAKLKKSETTGAENVLDAFKDAASIAGWSKSAIESMVSSGLMKGYPDSTFKPNKSITRAEAVSILERSQQTATESEKKQTIFDKAGTYGPEKGEQVIEGDVVISASNVTLKNTVITGDLILGEGIGNGDAFIKNVKVKGNTFVNGGGANSIHFENTVMVTVIVDRKTGNVRIVAEGSTTVQQVRVQSGATLEETNITGAGFTDVQLAQSLPAGSQVTLAGTFETVDVIATSIAIDLPRGAVNELNVDTLASNTNLNLGSLSRVVSLTLNAATSVSGQGTVESATVNTNGSTFQNRPDQVSLANNVNTTVSGQTVNTSTTAAGSSGGSGGAGNNNDDDDNQNQGDIQSIVVTPSSAFVKFNREINGEIYDDFKVTAKLDGTEISLEALNYHPEQKQFTFTSIPLQNNIGKTLSITVEASATTSKFTGSNTASVTIGTGFAGRITDVNNAGVANMLIKFRQGSGSVQGDVVATATTNDLGYYTVSLTPGVYTGELVKAGFITSYLVGVSLSDEYSSDENATAIRVAGAQETRIVLTWHESPRDIDSHLLGPAIGGGVFHTAYYDKEYRHDNTLYADLDWDDVTSYGPETTTIRQLLDGTYTFYVHNYSGESSMQALSGAKVEVYQGSSTQPVSTYTIPQGSGNESYWSVFKMVISGNDVNFIEVNEMTDVEPTSDQIGGESVISTADSILFDTGNTAGELTTGDSIKLQFVPDINLNEISNEVTVALYDGEHDNNPSTTSDTLVIYNGSTTEDSLSIIASIDLGTGDYVSDYVEYAGSTTTADGLEVVVDRILFGDENRKSSVPVHSITVIAGEVLTRLGVSDEPVTRLEERL